MLEHLKTLGLLKTVIHLSHSSQPLDQKLNQILGAIANSLHAEQCLFIQCKEIGRGGLLERLSSEKYALWVEDGSSFPKDKLLPQEEELIRPSFACLPLSNGTACDGILYISFSQARVLMEEEKDLLVLMAMEVGEAIRKSTELAKAEHFLFELTAFCEMGHVLTSTLKMEDLFHLILVTGARILKAKGGVLRLVDRDSGALRVRCTLGDYHHVSIDEKVARRALFTKMPLAFGASEKETSFRSLVCAPLISHGNTFGTLTYYDMEVLPSTFDEHTSQLLMTLVNQVSGSIENVLSHNKISDIARKQEERAKRLSVLWELNKALLTTVHFERILQLTLTAVTIGDGLGFNRAMLFLVNKKADALEGTMAVGPESAEEAGKIWNYLSDKKGSLSDVILELPPPSASSSSLNSAIKEIRIPLAQERCILSRTVFERRAFNIQVPCSVGEDPRDDCTRGCQLSSQKGCYVGKHLNHEPESYAFATVPLWGKGKVIGVILVDNLYNRNPIREDDLQFLSMFAHQAGLAIENARLYRNLEEVHHELKETQTLLIQREKMAALGEMINAVVHEIRNPLVSIGGFARRLYRSVSTDKPEKKYAQTIMIEVSRLEKILETLYHCREEVAESMPCDLTQVLEASLFMAWEESENEKIRVVKEFSGNLPTIIGDPRQLRQVFFNLITNACQAMCGEGTLSIRTYPMSQNGSLAIRVEVRDTGPGIDPESLPNIFNPFYSTKEFGLGLGLPVVHRIVTSHGGQIEVDNHPGKGTTFIITLPAQNKEERRSQIS